MVKINQMDRSQLMSVLWKVQRIKRHIGHDEITKIAQEFGLSRMEVEGIVTFFHFFHKMDSGKYTIYLNNSIISEQEGMKEVKLAFEQAIGIKTGNVSEDKMFGLFETACIGLSDQEPACLINFKPFTNLTPKKARYIISKIKNGERPSTFCDKPRSIIQYTPPIERTVFLKPYQRYTSLKFLEQNTPDEVIEMIKRSKLSGRGGAFFSTGLKWQFCRQNKADQKYIVCNADEGEPGTFKDRVLLQEYPELLIEGMITAAYAVGASQGIIYLRGEYMFLKKDVEKILTDYRKVGYLGKNIKGKDNFDFDISIHLGAGAYVCGEETALIHSMEGKRGEPSTKVVFPVEKGFKGKPTVVNNVETLSAVPRIIEMGLDKWLHLGTEKTPGTKLLSVSGDCYKKGIYEIEWGMNFRDFLEITKADNPKMVQWSGPSGNALSEEDFDRTISGEDLICGGSVMFFNQSRDILKILKQFSDFFVEESCGICVPCRTGNYLLNKKIKKMLEDTANQKDLRDAIEWSKIIKTTSRCGLGQMSSNSLNDAIKKYPEVFHKYRSDNSGLHASFNLESAIKKYDNFINEITSNYE